mmetsp:Transcript_18662/g.60859  ORF Transcript_18662/g.60859 Transcript_18662/m.60859 type:complete len:204 (+) Transcript_18662:869-1480(+)
MPVHERQLAERRARGGGGGVGVHELAQTRLVRRVLDVHVKLALINHVKVVTRISLLDDNVAGADVPRRHQREEQHPLLVREVREQKVGLDSALDCLKLLWGFSGDVAGWLPLLLVLRHRHHARLDGGALCLGEGAAHRPRRRARRGEPAGEGALPAGGRLAGREGRRLLRRLVETLHLDNDHRDVVRARLVLQPEPVRLGHHR